MNKFAKLFETNIGQVLVKMDTGEAGPEVRFYYSPEGFGVCSLAVQFEESEEGFDRQEKAFELSDEAQAISIALKITSTLKDGISSI